MRTTGRDVSVLLAPVRCQVRPSKRITDPAVAEIGVGVGGAAIMVAAAA
jgi:hypothetical protein